MPEGVRGSNGLVGFLGVLIAGGVLDWFLGEVLSPQFCLMYSRADFIASGDRWVESVRM